jgi:hypothetical protein
MRLFGRRPAPIAPASVVCRWDLDKTYLKSEFDTFRELVRIPFEKAEDKVAAPGVAALIRALRDTATRREEPIRIYFISASPPQIGRAIRQKLALDGVEYDGIVFKDQLHRIIRGKFRHLREQVGYKLTELLKARSNDLPETREYLFGDDWESDPLIYSLYADVLAGRVEPPDLRAILEQIRVDRPLVEQAVRLAETVEHVDAVVRIYINLEKRTPPGTFHSYGSRLVPTFNYFQTAACLYQDRALDEGGVATVVRSLSEDWAYSAERLLNSLADVERRGHLRRQTSLSLSELLRREGMLGGKVGAVARLRARWERLRAALRAAKEQPMAMTPIDYPALVGGHRAAGNDTEREGEQT